MNSTPHPTSGRQLSRYMPYEPCLGPATWHVHRKSIINLRSSLATLHRNCVNLVSQCAMCICLVSYPAYSCTTGGRHAHLERAQLAMIVSRGCALLLCDHSNLTIILLCTRKVSFPLVKVCSAPPLAGKSVDKCIRTSVDYSLVRVTMPL